MCWAKSAPRSASGTESITMNGSTQLSYLGGEEQEDESEPR